MRNFSGHVPFVLALALAWALASGCRSASPDRPASGGVLRIGTVANAPPLIFRQKGQWVGIEAELGEALAARMDMAPVFIAYPPSKLAPALLDGKVDILMAGLTITGERRVRMDFSVPYLVVGQSALIRSSDLLLYNTEIKIRAAKSRVGVVTDSDGERLAAKYFMNASARAFPRAEMAAEALRQKQIDMLIYDAPAVWWLALQYGQQLVLAPPLFAREEIAWAFRRSSVALRESANQALDDWQKNGRLESILRRWIPISK
jgi:ABC-type amino acid transport substrate-binding protein